jgi:dihydroflavonol-4-reductase
MIAMNTKSFVSSAQTSSSAPVVVTGASGFIAMHLVEQLLAQGYWVRGTVRRDPAGYDVLHGLPGASERLELVRADLTDDGAFDDVVAGAPIIMHTASPYAIDVQDAQRDLVDPAVRGTLNVLEACQKTTSVKRVIITSSMAAITDEPDSSHIYTEKDWNQHSSLTRNPYYCSKTLAERTAWDFVDQQSVDYDVVVINPFLVVGPSHGKSLNPSNQVFVDMLSGTYPGIMKMSWGLVDVRDVAAAHMLAMQNPKARGRNLCANETMSMREIVGFMRQEGFGKDHKVPTMGMDHALGTMIVKLSSYFQPGGVGSYLRTHIGRTPNFDHSKIVEQLGLTFTPMTTTLRDTFADLEQWEHITPRSLAQATT